MWYSKVVHIEEQSIVMPSCCESNPSHFPNWEQLLPSQNVHFSTRLHAGVDFNTSAFELSLKNSEDLNIIVYSINDESLPELTEGFLCYLEVIEDQLHPRDVGRIDFFNRLVLVRILDNDSKNVWTLVPVGVHTYVAPFNHLSVYMSIY